MARYHINLEGKHGVCSAKIKCEFELSDDEHYPNKAAALAAEVEFAAKNNETFSEIRKYSFVREFKRQEEEFEHEFEGVPTRFFNADLRKGDFRYAGNDELTLENLENIDLQRTIYADTHKLITGLSHSLSSPNDSNTTDEELIASGSRLGLDLKKVENERYLKALGVTEAWVHTEDYVTPAGRTQQMAYVVSPDKKIGQNMRRYNTRFAPEDGLPRAFRVLDSRTLIGADRLLKKTNTNIIQIMGREHQGSWRMGLDEEKRRDIVRAVLTLEEAQIEGKSFKAQQKYVRESAGKVATVWEAKKDTDDIRKEMADNSKLKGIFKKVDLDNDVDPEAFAKFEKDYLKIQEHLPKFPKGMEPTLHVRKLGKHSSSNFTVHGLFNPARNAVAIDIRDGGSTAAIHEVFHQWDIITKGNLSLSPEFRELSKAYSKGLKAPHGSKEEYYHTPTEQFARMAEIYTASKIKHETMLVNHDKFKSFDYTPITENPELQSKIFAFFDKHMAADD